MEVYFLHKKDVKGADEIWLMVMGPGIDSKGEIKKPMQLFQKQFAKTIGAIIGINFEGKEVADKVSQLW